MRVTGTLGTVFRGADLEAIMCVLAQQTAASLPGGTLKAAGETSLTTDPPSKLRVISVWVFPPGIGTNYTVRLLLSMLHLPAEALNAPRGPNVRGSVPDFTLLSGEELAIADHSYACIQALRFQV